MASTSTNLKKLLLPGGPGVAQHVYLLIVIVTV